MTMDSDEMLELDGGAADAAVSYTDNFLAAAIESIDAAFGSGFARKNPILVGHYIQASATNLSAFMQASAAMQASGMDDMLAALEEAMEEDESMFPMPSPPAAPPPPPSRKPRKRRS